MRAEYLSGQVQSVSGYQSKILVLGDVSSDQRILSGRTYRRDSVRFGVAEERITVISFDGEHSGSVSLELRMCDVSCMWVDKMAEHWQRSDDLA